MARRTYHQRQRTELATFSTSNTIQPPPYTTSYFKLRVCLQEKELYIHLSVEVLCNWVTVTDKLSLAIDFKTPSLFSWGLMTIRGQRCGHCSDRWVKASMQNPAGNNVMIMSTEES